MTRKIYNPFALVIAVLYSLRGSYAAILSIVISILILGLSVSQVEVFKNIDAKIRSYLLEAVEKVSSVNDFSQQLNLKIARMKQLRLENADLRQQNSMLRKQIEMQSIELSDLRKLSNELKYSHGQQFQSIATKVIGAAQSSDFIFINSGSVDGIAKGNVVINDEGVIGLVSTVYETHSQVRSVRDVQIRVPAITVDSRIRAIVRGGSFNNEKLLLNPLSDGACFKEGELVVTAGEGNLYPAGLVVGHIVSDKDMYFVASSVNWSNIQFVRVLTSIIQPK